MVDETKSPEDNQTLQEAMTSQENEPKATSEYAPPLGTIALPDNSKPQEPPTKPAKPKRPRGRPRKQPPTYTAPAPPATPQEYGQELILDIHEADPGQFTRNCIADYMRRLCDTVIHMEREDLHFWDYEDDPHLKASQPAHLKGVSAVQFIKTSNITIHTLDDLKKVFVNIFSCKMFNVNDAEQFTASYFGGKVARSATLVRQ
jgi:S-adenosylmethionine/arginine decarboxylase-like enzyme